MFNRAGTGTDGTLVPHDEADACRWDLLAIHRALVRVLPSSLSIPLQAVASRDRSSKDLPAEKLAVGKLQGTQYSAPSEFKEQPS